MKSKIFYSLCESRILGFLSDMGFTYIGHGVYTRQEHQGQDLILIDIDKSGNSFAAIITYYPNYLDVSHQIYELTDVSAFGYPVPAFLTPANVIQTPKTWPCNTEEKLTNSLEAVKKSIVDVGMPWLTKLRSPIFYAKHMDRVAAFDSALAFEAAGDIDMAIECYREVWRRVQLNQNSLPKSVQRNFFIKSPIRGKELIYVAQKLNLVDEFALELIKIHNYNPDIIPVVRDANHS